MRKKLGLMKPAFLNGVKDKANVTKSDIENWLSTFEDLDIEDLKGYISDELYISFTRPEEPGMEEPEDPEDPEETKLWTTINNMPENSVEQINAKLDNVKKFLARYPASKKAIDIQNMYVELQMKKESTIRIDEETRDWSILNKGNYTALQTYKAKYPNSVHLDELDDLMWKNTLAVMGSMALNRYLDDWPLGRHAEEAHQALNNLVEWESIKNSGDIFRVDDYRDSNPDSPFKNEINAIYFKLRDIELEKMRKNPSDYDKDEVELFINTGIFNKWQLIDEGLMTEDSWEKLQIDRDLFPNIQDYQIANPELAAAPDCTDIYLFGTPGTGKTCLLMGLAGADGHGYSLNMRMEGGPYASALQQYVNAGITPGRTFGSFVTTIHGIVNDQLKGRAITHPINLVEMSGEEFALHIADNQQVSLADMGTGATNLLRNSNRKVFFIIVDSTKDSVKFNYMEQVRDADGNIIEDRIRKRYISQLDILNKFVSLFALPENADIMRRVDAIHFIVTKADMLGDYATRKELARDLLHEKYRGPVQNLKNFCQQSKTINAGTKYAPQVFTFSLGKFYLGDVFDFDNQETLDIIEAIRVITQGKKETTWWDKVCSVFGE